MAASAIEVMVTSPSGRMVAAPAMPTSGAAMAPNAKRAIPSSDEAVPAICGYSASASVVVGGVVTATPLTMMKSETMTTTTGPAVSTGKQQPARPESAHGDADDERAANAPALGGAGGEESEDHESGGVEPEREGILLRRVIVDALQHEGGAGEVGEHGGVGESRDEHSTDEDPVGQKQPEVAAGLAESAGRAPLLRQRLAEAEAGSRAGCRPR